MAEFHGTKAVTAAGTSEPLVATTAETLARFCACVTIQYVGSNTIYGGFGVAESAVSSTTYGWRLTSSSPSVTIGDKASRQNDVDLAHIWIDTDTNGQGVRFFAEQV